MVKLIGIDMDGTLLDPQSKLSEENIKAIKYATSKGIDVVIASGRPVCESMRNYYKLLGLKSYYVGFNGAVVYDFETDAILYQKGITGKDVKELEKFKSQFSSVNSHAFILDTVLYEVEDYYVDLEVKVNYVKKKKIKFNDLADDFPIIKYMFTGSKLDIDNIINHVPEELKEKYNVVRSATYYLEFVNKEVDKARGIEIIARKKGLTKQEIMTIGDEGNDYLMVKEAGLGIAMGNARQKVKDVAKDITESNANNGVAHAIYKYIK